jgi:hypothetical protein
VQTWHMVPGPSLPQYCSCGQPMCWDYVSCIEEFPLGGEVVCQKMASQSEEGHQAGKKMLLLVQHGKAQNVIVLGSSLQIDHLVTHEKWKHSRKTPHGEGYLPCPLAEGKDLWQPCFEVEGGKDGLRQ